MTREKADFFRPIATATDMPVNQLNESTNTHHGTNMPTEMRDLVDVQGVKQELEDKASSSKRRGRTQNKTSRKLSDRNAYDIVCSGVIGDCRASTCANLVCLCRTILRAWM